jgi:hypothetical protein
LQKSRCLFIGKYSDLSSLGYWQSFVQFEDLKIIVLFRHPDAVCFEFKGIVTSPALRSVEPGQRSLADLSLIVLDYRQN